MEIINFKIEKQEYLHHFYLDDRRFEGPLYMMHGSHENTFHRTLLR